MDTTPKLLPVTIIARRLHLPVNWLRDEAEAGRLPHLRAGRHILFHPETVEQLLADRAKQTPPSAGGAK